MAESTANDLYQAFLEASGQQATELGETRYALQELVGQLQKTPEATSAQTAKNSGGSQTQTSSDSSTSKLLQVLTSGFGVASLVGGLVGLFSGGSEEPPPLVKYALPAAMNFEAAENGGQMTTADYDQTGMARGYPAAAATGPTAAGTNASIPQVTVNVQAMDSRSFMDRSGDIAMAVRDAMLNLNSINDVVNDL